MNELSSISSVRNTSPVNEPGKFFYGKCHFVYFFIGRKYPEENGVDFLDAVRSCI